MLRNLTSAVTIGALFALSSGAFAQNCIIGDDGLFTGDCCDFVSPDLPDFPAWDSEALWLSIRGCDPELRGRSKFEISAPTFITCDTARYRSAFSVDFGNNQVTEWEGRLVAKYARTFGHVTTTNRELQVWRFIINGDFRLAPTSFIPNGAQVPPSIALFDRVHFVGHIDYACDGQGGYDVAVSLQHLPGCIAHGALSDRPATGPLSHPDRSYYLIAPRAFNVGLAQGTEPQGTLMGDDMRFTTTPFQRCFSEQRIRETGLESIDRGCPCLGPFGSMPWYTQETRFAASCGSQTTVFSPVAIGPVVPAGLNLQVVGEWALPAGQYPERQTLIHYQAVVEASTPVACNPFLQTEHFIYGVGMKGNRNFSLHPTVNNQAYDNNIDLVNAVARNTQAFSWGRPSFASIHIGLFVQ